MKLSRTEINCTEKKLFRFFIDEAGRGPLAGPVVVGVVMTSQPFKESGVSDSKVLTPTQRTSAYRKLQSLHKSGQITCGSGYADQGQIDKKGIISALRSACIAGIFGTMWSFYTRWGREHLLASVFGEDILAVYQFDSLFARGASHKTLAALFAVPQTLRSWNGLFIDGNHTFGLETILPYAVRTITKGDQKHAAISAASIIAKVERDRCMEEIANIFPDYGFAQHKGYGTPQHSGKIKKYGLSSLHRTTFCSQISLHKSANPRRIQMKHWFAKHAYFYTKHYTSHGNFGEKPRLLLHICCAPDLTRPLHWLKNHFHLCLFWYNPNIHPRAEHTKRYEQFLKLIGLEQGEYDIIEDRYDPKEFFQAMIDQKESIDPKLQNADKKTVLKVAGKMEERSDRCNPCYSMRLSQAAKTAAEHNIPYFSSTLLISPKKHMNKLFQRGVDAEATNPSTKFLWFDFAKNEGYRKAVELTRRHSLRRQNYCGCGRTVNKKNSAYSGG